MPGSDTVSDTATQGFKTTFYYATIMVVIVRGLNVGILYKLQRNHLSISNEDLNDLFQYNVNISADISKYISYNLPYN